MLSRLSGFGRTEKADIGISAANLSAEKLSAEHKAPRYGSDDKPVPKPGCGEDEHDSGNSTEPPQWLSRMTFSVSESRP